MSRTALKIFSQHLFTQQQNLELYREYQKITHRPNIKSTLDFLIDDAREAIALIASRLRQFNARPGDQTLPDGSITKIRRAQSRRSEVQQIKYVWRNLDKQLEAYQIQIQTLADDSDTQATLITLVQYTEHSLQRWEALMKEMKVSPDRSYN